MRCFSFPSTDKKEEPKTPKSVTSLQSSSTSAASTTDHDARTSLNVSEISTGSSVVMSFTSLSHSHRQSNLREFAYEELRTATKNFSRSVMLGEGGFGGVYRGVIREADGSDRKIDVAVKQLSRRGLQGHKEWVTEVNVLGIVEHPNLVKLHGYCAEDNERGMQRLLVYEYLPNRSVLDHLSSRFQATLPWATRLRVAEDAARGLAYLHEGMDFQIIFRDFKSSNILLDDQWKAKLSDFGLARLGPSDGVSHVSTAVVGTVGYAAPEYIQTGRLTSKSDVWSYGVFLYELITGRRPLDRNRPKNEQKLLEWVRPHLSDPKKFEQIMDPRIYGKYCLNTAQKLAAVANKCLVRHPKNRPRMSEVLEVVSKVVEESCIGSPEWPLRSSLKESEEKSKADGLKKAFVELVAGEHKWQVRRIWISKLVKTSSQRNA